jgi:hypothetical protein
MFSVGKITKYWLILFKIEVKKIIVFVPMTGKKLINGHMKINYIVVHVVITVATHFLGQKVELKQDPKLFNFL